MGNTSKTSKKIRFLAGLVAVLALIYAGTLIFEPEQVNSRNASLVWLDAKWQDQADSIEIRGPGEATPLTLIRKNNAWFVSRDDREYPAKQARIDDFLRLLTTRGTYPVRGSEAASHERLGLTEDTASRLIIRAGASAYPLVDLFIGHGDVTGSEVYLRKNNQHEVRSGKASFSTYIASPPTAWLNLRLFPEHENQGLTVAAVQRVTVIAPAKPTAEEGADGTPGSPLILGRNAGGWTVNGTPGTDAPRVESYIRSILDAEGEDFIATMQVTDPVFNEGRITLELGNGLTRTISIGPALESNRRNAVVSGGAFVHALAGWTVERIFKDAAYFE